MEEHANAARMRQAPEAVSAGDIPRALELFSEDLVWQVPGKSPIAGTYTGREGLQRFFGSLFERSAGTLKVETDDALGSDDHVVIFLRVTARPDGTPLDVTVAHFATVDAEGRFQRNWFLPDDIAAWDRFFE
jgi:uncharacterized protein